MSTIAAQPSQRLVFADWVRILAFGLLVLYHVGMYYVTWDWHIKSPHAGAALEPWMRLVSPWRMDLLFLVSGVATSFMLRRNGADGALLGARAKRLLIPLAFGMLAIVPPQSYFEVMHKHGFAGDYVDFMRLYLTGYGGFCGGRGGCLILPTWNHLWFLSYLFVYTLLAWAMLRVRPDLPDRLARALPGVLRGAWLFVVPIGLLAVSLALLIGRFPVTHALVDDWFAHAQYFAFFALGIVLARTPVVWQRMQQVRWFALAIGLGGWALLVSGLLVLPEFGSAARLLRFGVYSTVQWCGVLAAFGFAHRHLNRDGALRRYLTDAVFPVYILHQTLTILLARALAPADLAPAAEGLLLVAGTFALSFAGYECVRRVPWARPLFGLKPEGGKAQAQREDTTRMSADQRGS
jgi:surface polysaccharide O-acyltransferase-like enzyme